jgi:exodeoxyribonuclease VII small subunit
VTNTGFEKALAELEEVVAKLEKGGPPLADSLALFEKGVKLARYLRAELEKAERKVEILLKDEKGGLRAEDFSLEDETEKRTVSKARAKGKAKAAADEGPEDEGAEADEDDGDGDEGKGAGGGGLF